MNALAILGVIILISIISQIIAMSSRRKIEAYPYTLVQTYEQFEIRDYEGSLFTSVKIASSDYGQVANRGFSILAGYIFGGNEKKEKIAMTSPVAMTLEDNMTVMFMVPKAYQKENLPKPNQSVIQFREEPPKRMAVIHFGGWASSEKINRYKEKLILALESAGIEHTNRFYFFGYNPPYDLINRRNEVAVELL